MLQKLFKRKIIRFLFFYYSKYDLYSKSKTRVDVEKVKPYYLSLIKKVNHQLLVNGSMFTFFI